MNADRDAALAELDRRLRGHLAILYPDADHAALSRRLIDALALEDARTPEAPRNKWDQNDALLITYGNSIRREGEAPLASLRAFMARHLGDTITGVHVLPFFPYSSDDGFAVLNYLQVNEALGDWSDIEALAANVRLMADLVINHASSRCRWFDNFRAGRDPGRDYFVTSEPDADIADVVRPRPSQLLQPFETVDGTRHVWCTFGPDQVDLNFANPDVLCEFASITARYLEAGVRILRLDAVAFLWKRPGTSCMHLQETHELIKLLRNLAEFKQPDAVIITETNVPNRDNLTYFGNANEAHAIYNFSLPPLLIHTLLTGDCRHLKTWMMSMPPAQQGTCYLNFIASHDGVGLRPTEGLLDADELQQLLDTLREFGAHISMRRGADGELHPYEANVSLWSALSGTVADGPDAHQLARFVCAHAIMFALEGIPAVYVHSLFGTPNDHAGVERSGRYRSINRRVLDADELEAELADPASRPAQVFGALRRLLAIRRRQSAFHPNAVQFTMHLGLGIFGFWRQSIDRRQSIFCLSNVRAEGQEIDLGEVNLIGTDNWVDLLGDGAVISPGDGLTLRPYQTVWLSNRDGEAAV